MLYEVITGMLVLLVTSFIFLFISVYSVAYLNETQMGHERVFLGCMLLFLATMSMVALADHLIVLWIAIEATTLVSAPLIFMHRITSYNVCYTKLLRAINGNKQENEGGDQQHQHPRITSYNVCYTKLLRVRSGVRWALETVISKGTPKLCSARPASTITS